jgi:hypothetical protein
MLPMPPKRQSMVEQIVRNAEVVQSMRTGTFGDFVVLGSQHRDRSGELHWYIALVSEHSAQPRPKIHHVVKGAVQDGVTQDQREAMFQAIGLWESEPASRPN